MARTRDIYIKKKEIRTAGRDTYRRYIANYACLGGQKRLELRRRGENGEGWRSAFGTGGRVRSVGGTQSGKGCVGMGNTDIKNTLRFTRGGVGDL